MHRRERDPEAGVILEGDALYGTTRYCGHHGQGTPSA
jgi:hypothetical protein